jgi:hypothetical protein
MRKVYVDCETCGLHGVPVTIQYAYDDGPIFIHEVWRRPIHETLALIEDFCKCEVIGFNLAFDWFHIQKIYTLLRLWPTSTDIPRYHVKEIAKLEKQAMDGPCIKPASALDLMLHFRKTELQITMERDDVRIKRVPGVLAKPLADVLTKKLSLDPILFAGYKKFTPRFKVMPVEMEDGTEHPYLKNVVLKFRPSSGLKALAVHLLGETNVTSFQEVEVDKKLRPKEYGYAPFAAAVDYWSWVDVLHYHIDHWASRADARKYAEADVDYTRRLHEYTGWVAGGDDDSVLACSVASCRWRGYRVDVELLKKVRDAYRAKLKAPMSPNAVKEWINEVLNPIEQAMCWRKGTSKKALLELKLEWKEINPEAARRAEAVLEARKAKKKIEVMEKLIKAGRFHASTKVIGALSGRMSGTDGLNAQGIDKTKEVRSCFYFAFLGWLLRGGDMQSFEIGIAEAFYGDPELRRLLTTCATCDLQMGVDNGRITCPKCKGLEAKSFHAIFGAGFFPELGYDGIMATKGLTVGNVYNPVKNGAFASLYGAQAQKLAETINCTLEEAIDGLSRFWTRFAVAGKKVKELEQDFTSLVSVGRGFKYKQPQEYVESLTGYKRYFTLENYIIKELFHLINNLPESWKKLNLRITRSRKGEQSVAAAITSALYGCAFGIQNAVIRQARNHTIQSTGAIITKRIQRAIWDMQPAGTSEWIVQPTNIHDEIQCPVKPEYAEALDKVVREKVEEFRPLVPLIGIDWGPLETWADK